MKLSIIVAVSKNGAIGVNNNLPWRLVDDMANFTKLTTNNIVVMGSKTFKSIPKKFRPLPNRINIIISSNYDKYNKDGIISYKDILSFIEDYSEETDKEIFIIGGESIYNKFLPISSKIYLTLVDTYVNGDRYFPYFDELEWGIEEEHYYKKNNNNDYNFLIRTLVRPEKGIEEIIGLVSL